MVLAALAAGYDVRVVCGHSNSERDRRAAAELGALGVRVHPIAFRRSATNPVDLVATIWAMRRELVRIRPNILHTVSPKMVICGAIAARLAGVQGLAVAISGLGYLQTANGPLARLRSVAAQGLYAVALRHPRQVVIVQNPDDERKIAPLVPSSTPFVRFFGSGVELDRFVATPLPAGPAVVLLASRMLRSKGIPEFCAAAAMLRARGVSARFVLCGAPDPGNPDSYRLEEIEALVARERIEYWGFREEMAATWREATIACLPSAYGEGLPLALAEAAASGRPIVTTDTPGCRETVRDGESGVLIPPHDAGALAAALEALLADPSRLTAMAAASRQLAEARFSVEHVTSGHLAVYLRLLDQPRTSATSLAPS